MTGVQTCALPILSGFFYYGTGAGGSDFPDGSELARGGGAGAD